METSVTISIFILLAFWALAASAQEKPGSKLLFHRSLPISSPSTISQDQEGSIFIIDPKRTLYKLDPAGNPLLNFSPPVRGRISAIEAWNPMKVLLFYEDSQEILLLDRFLRPISTTALTNYDFSGLIRAASLSPDDGFWLFNERNFTLTKLDIRSGNNVVETPLNLILDHERFDIRFIREYQNMVYMLDVNGGIYVFDNLGNYKKKLPFTGLSYIGFSGNELYYIKNNKLHFFDLYALTERTIDLPASKKYVSALTEGEYIYLFTKNQMEVYSLLP